MILCASLYLLMCEEVHSVEYRYHKLIVWRCFAKRNLGFKMGKGVVLRSNVLSFVSVAIRESEVGCAGHAEVRDQSYKSYGYKEQRVSFCSSGSRRDVSVTTSHYNCNNRPLNHSTVLPYSFVLDISCCFFIRCQTLNCSLV